jgi:hypothetical protein
MKRFQWKWIFTESKRCCTILRPFWLSCLNFDCIMSIVSCLNFAQIGGFLYFAGYFGFKMAAIANQNGRNMVQPDPFETWYKNRSSLKVVLFVFKIFKMTANIKIKQMAKNSKWKDFNGNEPSKAAKFHEVWWKESTFF